MTKNISVHNELKKVKIKWQQLVGDKDKQKTQNKTITLIQSALLNHFFVIVFRRLVRFLSSL
jgi:hypothetical protein